MRGPVGARTARARNRATWVRWRLVLLLMGFTGLNHFHRQSLPAVVNDVMRDCRFTETDMSWVYSAFLFGYVVSMIAGGRLADRRGGWLTIVLAGFGPAAFGRLAGYCQY